MTFPKRHVNIKFQYLRKHGQQFVLVGGAAGGIRVSQKGPIMPWSLAIANRCCCCCCCCSSITPEWARYKEDPIHPLLFAGKPNIASAPANFFLDQTNFCIPGPRQRTKPIDPPSTHNRTFQASKGLAINCTLTAPKNTRHYPPMLTYFFLQWRGRWDWLCHRCHFH